MRVAGGLGRIRQPPGRSSGGIRGGGRRIMVVILAFLLNWLALLLAGVFAAVALLYLLSDREG